MMSLSRTHLLRPIDGLAGAATACSGSSDGARNAEVLPGDDLIRHLPPDREFRAAPTSLAVATRRISSARTERLSQVSASLGTGCDAFFMVAFATLLARLAGQEIVRLQNILDDSNLVAFKFDPEVSFRSLLTATLSQNPSRDQPCAVEYVFGGEGSEADFPRDRLRMTVQVLAGEGHTECQIRLVSSTGLWGPSVLHLWLRYYDRLLAAIAAATDFPWKGFPLLDPIEVQEFYSAFNRTAAAYPDNTCIHELVIRQAERTPDATAVVSELQCLIYRQLHERSDAIARRLRALGAGPGRPVAISLERSALLPVALLGILKSGSCYIPLDQQDSPERLTSILEECRPAAMIVDQSFPRVSGTETVPIIYPDDFPDPSPGLEFTASDVTADHQAYIIYTSGTTGKPKGVMITHRALSNLLGSMMRAPGFTPADRMLAVVPTSFDIATMDMFLKQAFGFSLPEAVFNNTWSRIAAIQNYAPSRYPGRVVLFRAADVPQLPSSDETLGWKEIVDDGVEVVFVPGDH